ncbi:YjbH domain-containing protein [Escherichia coli]
MWWAHTPPLPTFRREEYGEGEFTKGVYVNIPMDLFTSGPTRSRAVVGWTPLTARRRSDAGSQVRAV